MYATVAMATDYDCWRESEDNVNAADVIIVFKQNVDKMMNLLLETVKIIGSVDWEQDILKLKVSFFTEYITRNRSLCIVTFITENS